MQDQQVEVARRERSCSASSERMTRGTVSTAKSQTLGPFMTKVLSRFSSTSWLTGSRVPPPGTWMWRLPRPSLPRWKWMRPARLVGLREQHGARAVAEEDAGPAIVPVHDLGEGVGADDQRVAVSLGGGQHHALRDVEREDEAGADGVDVERRALAARRRPASPAPGRRRPAATGRAWRRRRRSDRRPTCRRRRGSGSAAPPDSPCRWAPRPSAASRRSRMPVLAMIQSCEVSMRLASSWLVTVLLGT